jgi:hypothetical protein
VGGQRHAQAVLPPGNDPVPIVYEAAWVPGSVWKISPPQGYDTWTVKSIASRYTD